MQTLDTNPYVCKLDTEHKGFSQIPEITTHCAAALQKQITGEGQITVNKNERSYVSKVTLNLLEHEFK